MAKLSASEAATSISHQVSLCLLVPMSTEGEALPVRTAGMLLAYMEQETQPKSLSLDRSVTVATNESL